MEFLWAHEKHKHIALQFIYFFFISNVDLLKRELFPICLFLRCLLTSSFFCFYYFANGWEPIIAEPYYLQLQQIFRFCHHIVYYDYYLFACVCVLVSIFVSLLSLCSYSFLFEFRRMHDNLPQKNRKLINEFKIGKRSRKMYGEIRFPQWKSNWNETHEKKKRKHIWYTRIYLHTYHR